MAYYKVIQRLVISSSPFTAPSAMNPSDADEGTPVSVKIRERLLAARKRFHANDNIADFIQPGELECCSTRLRSR